MSNRNSKLLFLALLATALCLRLARILPNLEFVTTAMITASFYLSRKHAVLLTLTILVASDALLGNTRIFLFTWTGFLLPALIVPSLGKSGSVPKTTLLLASGVASNIFFYLWTNFGVWFLDSWGMYPKTFAGLISCYINGLPFLKNQLASALLFVPITSTILRLTSKISSPDWLRRRFFYS